MNEQLRKDSTKKYCRLNRFITETAKTFQVLLFLRWCRKVQSCVCYELNKSITGTQAKQNII